MVIYNLLIQPLILIIDMLFVFLYDYFGVPAVAVIFLGVIVNLLVLPMYMQADRLQKVEQAERQKMKSGIDHIKKTFSGDEQYMMLAAYYRVEHYNPVSILNESLPLLLQVPVFIAAYRYLSNAAVLTGVQFGPIHDLGAPDRLLVIGNVVINVLPIIMTMLNLVSGLVYSRGQGVRIKLQVFGLAAVFMVLLYNSSAALVLYWTTSQVFSLVKNLIMEAKILKERKILMSLSIATIIIVLISMALQIIQTRTGAVISELCLILAIIYLIRTILELKQIRLPSLKQLTERIPQIKLGQFITIGFSLFALMGLCIPASVLSASVSEFVDTTTGQFQTFLLTYPLTVYAGLFLIWVFIYYCFLGKMGRKLFFGFLLVIYGTSLVNYFAFDIKPEFYYTDLSFDGSLIVPHQDIVFNLLCIAAAIALFVILWLKHENLLKSISLVFAAALLFLGVFQAAKIPKTMKIDHSEMNEVVQNEEEKMNGIFALSRTEKNVIILMMDRAIGAQVPFIFDEFPEWKEAFDGFVYYPNTVSFATHTMVGAPPLYGGYEYTPKRIEERTDSTDWAQRVEALKVLPVLFSENGFHTVVCDPPIGDLTSLQEYSDITVLKLGGKFNSKYADLYSTSITPIQKRNFLVFSLYKTAPLYMRDYIYDNGRYVTAENSGLGYTQPFIDNYSTLMEYPNLTEVSASERGTFLFLQNATTHEPTVLEAPEYEVKPPQSNYEIDYGDRIVDGRIMKLNDFTSWKHYCVNVITYRELVRWFERMKDLGVYDNTKIIIASDHGGSLGQFDDLILPDGYDVEAVNPLLMVKDFYAKGTMRINDALMSNADVPTLATENVIEKPINPITGVLISSEDKVTDGLWIERKAKRVRESAEDDLSAEDYIWMKVHDSIFNQDNWEMID